MSALTFKKLEDTIENYDLFLFDLWGVIVEGNLIYDGVIDSINKIKNRQNIKFLTNAPRPNYRIMDKLKSWGIENITAEMIISSGDIARQLITEHEKYSSNDSVKIFHLGADRNEDILLEIKHEPVTDINSADILLLSLYRDEHENLIEFDYLLKATAQKQDLTIICSNPDTIIPNEGKLRYCSGFFAEIIEKNGGKVIYTGKPKNLIYDKVLELSKDIPKNRILMIGDTFETDILGARNCGINSALVLTGNSSPFHKNYDLIEDKLSALSFHADKIGIAPTFVTSIT